MQALKKELREKGDARDGDVAEGEEVRTLVAGHEFDGVDEDLSDEGAEQVDGHKSTDAPSEEMHSALAAVGVDRLAGLGREEPEHDLSHEDLEERLKTEEEVEPRRAARRSPEHREGRTTRRH